VLVSLAVAAAILLITTAVLLGRRLA